jgi:xylulokinase
MTSPGLAGGPDGRFLPLKNCFPPCRKLTRKKRAGRSRVYLGLDVGTSSVKAVLIDGAQRVIASRTAPLEVSRPHSGWSEQDPDSWWTACETVLDGLAASHPKEMAALKGIGLSGHMHGATLLDAADKPLRPCILWNDVRSAEEAAALDRYPIFRRLTGNIVFPGFTAPKLV